MKIPEYNLKFFTDNSPVEMAESFINTINSREFESRTIAAVPGELDKILDSGAIDFSGLICLTGAVSPAFLTKLLSRTLYPSTLIICENDLPAFAKTLAGLEIQAFSDSKTKIFFAVCSDNEKIADFLRKKLREYSENAFSLMESCVDTPHRELAKILSSEINTEHINRLLCRELAEEWLENTFSTLDITFNAPRINELKDKFTNKTVLLIAPGPSLEKSLPYIKNFSDRVFIIAVGTALKPLQAAGIEPDFAVVVDARETTLRQFEGLDAGKTFMIGTQLIRPEIFRKYLGRNIIFTTDALPGLNLLLEKNQHQTDSLMVAGTVSATALHAAAYMGFSTIILSGLDLSFLNDGTSYSAGTGYDPKRYANHEPCMVEGNYSEKVPSSRPFANYIKAVNNITSKLVSEYSALKIFNATNGGAKLDNVTLIRPEQLISMFQNLEPVPKEKLIEKIIYAGENSKKNFSIMIGSLIPELEKVAKASQRGAEACRIILEANGGLSYARLVLKELDKIDAEISACGNGAILVKWASLLKNRELTSCKCSRSGNEILEQNLNLYEYMKKMAVWLNSKLKNYNI